VSARFTIDGSAALEARLATLCGKTANAVASMIPGRLLAGLALGGGYGRGEGGVLRTPEGDLPYNDLEFYVFLNGPALTSERRFRGPLHELGERLTPEAGIEVEFKALGLSKFQRAATTMFYYDLTAGHRLLIGHEGIFEKCPQHRDASRIPLFEATRLLMNRCSGLLFCADRLARPTFAAGEADYCGRNLAKARLAFGDVVLAARGEYHWSCRERHRRLRALGSDAAPNIGRLVEWHEAGVEFKLHPRLSVESREALASQRSELAAAGCDLWLWLESRRLGRRFGDITEYVKTLVDKCPESPAWRNRLVNARAFGWTAAFGPRGSRYPRERLFHALALLLWTPEGQDRTAKLEGELGHRPDDGWTAAYDRLWRRFQ
jgi:hypothetical protein